MKRRVRLVLFLSLSFSLLAGCATTPVQPREPVHIVLVGTTDVHGWFNGHDDKVGASRAPLHYGGLPIFTSYVSAIRAANPGHVVLLDSGDMFQGTLESNLFEGEPVVRAYNALGYSASAVGNHEFDYGPVGPDPVVRQPGQDPLGALKKNASMAKFPFLSANMVDKATGDTPAWAKRSTIVDVAGVRVGIIGLSTPDTPNTTVADNVTTLAFTDPVEATLREAKALRAAGVDAIVVIAHMGGRCSDLHDPKNIGSCEVNQEAMKFLQALPEGTADAYFAGHTHAQMRQYINGIPTVQASPFSIAFSTIDLWVDPASHHVVSSKSTMREHTMICSDVFAGTVSCDPRQAPADPKLETRVFEGRQMRADAGTAAILDPYLQRVAAKRNEPLGITLAVPFTRAYSRESTLGDLLTDALRADSGADIALLNSGGIRMNLPAKSLVYSDVFEVSPFDNYVSIVPMTGAQIIQMLRISTAADRGILQISGLRYTFDATRDADKPVDQRNRLVAVTLPDGDPIDPHATYRVAMPDFLAKGGDGLAPVMSAIPASEIRTDLARTIRDAIIDALRKYPQPVGKAEGGRITVLNAQPLKDDSR